MRAVVMAGGEATESDSAVLAAGLAALVAAVVQGDAASGRKPHQDAKASTLG